MVVELPIIMGELAGRVPRMLLSLIQKTKKKEMIFYVSHPYTFVESFAALDLLLL